MNRELLARVRDRIAEVGNEHCDMGRWTKGTMPGDGEPRCGTTACLAGHAVAVELGSFAAYKYRDELYAQRAALRLLDFPSESAFYANRWPQHYIDILNDEGDAKGMLAVCDALLDGNLVFDADGCLIEAP